MGNCNFFSLSVFAFSTMYFSVFFLLLSDLISVHNGKMCLIFEFVHVFSAMFLSNMFLLCDSSGSFSAVNACG